MYASHCLCLSWFQWFALCSSWNDICTFYIYRKYNFQNDLEHHDWHLPRSSMPMSARLLLSWFLAVNDTWVSKVEEEGGGGQQAENSISFHPQLHLFTLHLLLLHKFILGSQGC